MGIFKHPFCSAVGQSCHFSKHGDGTRQSYAVEPPADWKEDSVIPVYKGMREILGNYRPVSPASVPGKITENIILGATERPLKEKAQKTQESPV